MKKSNINYPHPVLSAANEDYLNCTFDVVFDNDPVIQGELAVIELSYNLECDGLSKMITNGDAKVVLYLESVESEYRKIFVFKPDSTSMIVKENKNLFGKNLQVRCYITAAKDISPFSLPEHNKELFGLIPFNVKRGDVLAISENLYNIPLENYDPLLDRPSIFSVRRQTENPKEEIMVDFVTHDKITIFLNNEIFEKYDELYRASEIRMFLASLFAAPVLVDVLSYIKHADQDMLDSVLDKKWYQVLKSRLSELDIDLAKEDSMTKVANMVVPHIFKQNIEQFKVVFKNSLPMSGDEE